MAGTVYLLVVSGRNYLALREKRLANAALTEGQKQTDGSPASLSAAVLEQEQGTSEV